MKANVQRAYVDKTTKVLLKQNEVIEVTKKRFEEINGAGYGILLKEIKELKK